MTQSADPKRTLSPILTMIVAGICVGLIVVHALVPNIQIDVITIALILLPFFVYLLPSFVEIEGFGVRMRRSEIDKSIDKAKAAIEVVEATESIDTTEKPLPKGIATPRIEDQKLAPIDTAPEEIRLAPALFMMDMTNLVPIKGIELLSLAYGEPIAVPSRIRLVLDTQLYLLIEDHYRFLEQGDIPGAPENWREDVSSRTSTQLLSFALTHQILREQEYDAIASVYRSLNEAIHSPASIDTRQAFRLIDIGDQAFSILAAKRNRLNPGAGQEQDTD